MKRFLYEDLLKWKNDARRKPLVLEGARQVGKTWLLREFGRREFENVAYINCDLDDTAKLLFTDFNTDRILRAVSAITSQVVIPGKTLVVFDEIQEQPQGLTALKYFCENATEYHIAVAGSLLGLQVHSGSGFPVGKVDRLKLCPLSFCEFLDALGEKNLLAHLKEFRFNEYAVLKSKLIELLRQYYYVGGMPEAVLAYAERRNILEVREIQKQILDDYQDDFSKHIPANELAKVSAVWNSIPSQLAKENKKFIWGALRKGGRAKDYENAVQWLMNAGLVHKVCRINKVEMPIKFYEDAGCFKLFVNDLGLLGAMSDIPAKEILAESRMITEYKGAFTEQYVAQQYIATMNQPLYYYTNENSTSEIEFVFQQDAVFPTEVKAEENLKAKSLSTVLKSNASLKGIRFSMSDYREQERMVNVPLYLVEFYLKWIIGRDAMA